MSYLQRLLHVLLGIIVTIFIAIIGTYTLDIDSVTVLYCYFKENNLLNKTIKHILTHDENGRSR